MKTAMIMVGAALAMACSSAGPTHTVKTPEQRLEEQLALAEEQQAKEDEYNERFEEGVSESEEAEKFDEENAKHELKRATLNAQDCPNTFEKEQLGDYRPGTATVTITWSNEGSVKELSVAPPYEGTTVGKCVERAMGTVFVKKYVGPEKTMEWEIELGEPKPPEKAKPAK